MAEEKLYVVESTEKGVQRFLDKERKNFIIPTNDGKKDPINYASKHYKGDLLRERGWLIGKEEYIFFYPIDSIMGVGFTIGQPLSYDEFKKKKKR
jgi:hypothetical protein